MHDRVLRSESMDSNTGNRTKRIGACRRVIGPVGKTEAENAAGTSRSKNTARRFDQQSLLVRRRIEDEKESNFLRNGVFNYDPLSYSIALLFPSKLKGLLVVPANSRETIPFANYAAADECWWSRVERGECDWSRRCASRRRTKGKYIGG